MFEISEDIKIIEWPELIKDKPINRIDLKFMYSIKLSYDVLI